MTGLCRQFGISRKIGKIFDRYNGRCIIVGNITGLIQVNVPISGEDRKQTESSGSRV